eukprot:1357940-Lingulodinium_polyedra.AAC.1
MNNEGDFVAWHKRWLEAVMERVKGAQPAEELLVQIVNVATQAHREWIHVWAPAWMKIQEYLAVAALTKAGGIPKKK